MKRIVEIFFSNKLAFRAAMLTVACALLLISCTKNTDEKIMAQVGGRTVTEKQLNGRLDELKKRTGITTTTGQQLKELLSGIVEEELLIGEAWKKGYGDDALAKHEKERLEIQELLNRYHRKLIRSRVSVSDSELVMLYTRFNTKVKARHLYAESREKADSLYKLLQNGSDFRELAMDVFKSPELRRTGGSVGYFTVDEMDPFFEDAAYSLDVGELSPPIKTAAGFSVIQVEDKIANPILTESVFQQRKSRLHAYWFKHKMLRETRTHSDSIASALNIQFNNDTATELLRQFAHNKNSDELQQMQPTEGLVLDDALQNAVLVESRLGVWTVQDFQKRAQFTSEKQQNWIRNPFTMREFVSGLIVRDAMLEKAKDMGLDKTGEFESAVRTNLETWMLQRMEDEMTAAIIVPEDSMQAYFAEDPGRFAKQPEFALNEIVVLKQETADSIKSMIDKGADFDTLRRLYSVFSDPTEKTGYFPFYTAEDFGNLATDIRALKIGEYIGPVRMNEKFVFLRCEDRRAGKIRTFTEARPDVEKTLKYMMRDDYRRQALAQIRENYDVNVFYDKIKSLRLQ